MMFGLMCVIYQIRGRKFQSGNFRVAAPLVKKLSADTCY